MNKQLVPSITGILIALTIGAGGMYWWVSAEYEQMLAEEREYWKNYHPPTPPVDPRITQGIEELEEELKERELLLTLADQHIAELQHEIRKMHDEPKHVLD